MREEETEQIEKNILSRDILLSFLFIGTLLVSIYLTYNEIKRIEKEHTNTSLKFDQTLNVINRVIGILILIGLLITSIDDLKLAKKKGDDPSIFIKQLLASILNLTSGLIILFVVIEAIKEDNELGVLENPIT